MAARSEADPLLLERARGIRLLVLDVDGVLTDGRLYFDRHGDEMKVFHTRDGLGMKAVQRHGIELALITARESSMVRDRAAQLGIQHVYQGREDKWDACRELLAATGIKEREMCYAGDDLLDLAVLRRAGLSVAPADAHPAVRERVDWVTSLGGGRGAVREICDLLLAAHGAMQALIDEALAGNAEG